VHAPKCLHCNGPVAQIPNKFCGKYYNVPAGGQVHNECWQAFNAAADSPVEKCTQCKHSLAPMPDHFTGKFLQMGNGDKVHEECRM
jgi:hypothetical protein